MSHHSQDRTARADRSAEGLWDEQQRGVLSNRDANFVERHADTLDEHADLGWKGGQQVGAPSALVACEGSQHYDVLLTDVILPGGMNGRELADRLASARPRLRVLFTSGYSQRAIEIQGVLMPGATLLHKPFRKAELAKKVRDVISGPPYASVAQEHWPSANDAAE